MEGENYPAAADDGEDEEEPPIRAEREAALLGRPDLAPTPWPGSKATSGGSTFPLFRVRGPPSSTARGGPLLVPALPLATRPSRGSCRGHATCACAPTRCAPVGNVTLPPPVPAPGFLAAASPALAVPSATHDPVVRRRRQSPSTCRASTHPVSSERRASASPFFLKKENKFNLPR